MPFSISSRELLIPHANMAVCDRRDLLRFYDENPEMAYLGVCNHAHGSVRILLELKLV